MARLDGAVVGTLGLGGKDFAVLREVRTGSWVGQAYQGRGVGTAMRAAVLFLAFERLGAQPATSGAYADNLASLAVSRKLGYADDGIERHMVRGCPPCCTGCAWITRPGCEPPASRSRCTGWRSACRCSASAHDGT